jgi:K+-sensing histidine kinase KdpD
LTLFHQILAEKVLLLREQGYDVSVGENEDVVDALEGVLITTDAPKLMRIAENIFSNITKYADKSHTVAINSCIEHDKILVEIVNKVLQNSKDVESNGIGIKTCRKLAELLNIGFSAERVGDYFSVKLVLNIVRGDKA